MYVSRYVTRYSHVRLISQRSVRPGRPAEAQGAFDFHTCVVVSRMGCLLPVPVAAGSRNVPPAV